MDVHASPDPLPELQGFLSRFQVRFHRPEARAALERYTTGLLTELPNKNCDTMAQAVPGTSEQRLQGFLSSMAWDEEDLNRQRVQLMLATATLGDGVLLLDDTGFAKQGKNSVGVARQYSGTLGKVGNCQVAVTCCYSDPWATWPVGVRLYLPEAWTQDLGRCRQAGVPPEVGFQTKPEIALALLDQARRWGVPHHCVVADADYGDNPNFLAGLEERGEPYVVGVRADFRVSLATQAPRRRADQVLAALPRSLWGTIRWRQGSKGWLRKKFVALYCWRRTRNGAVGEGWLLGERPARGQQGEYKYYWSNLPATTPLEKLVEYSHRRHAIEQFHEEAKGELGWDQYQGRRWRGFHRHAATVMLAYSFLVWLEVQHRSTQQGPGRPRNPFSPTAGPQAEAASRGASGGSLLATAPGSAVVGDHGAVHPAMFPQELTK
ncbi:MAG TPA: IS701 family transposase [Dehalococcoidia bacterium]|jgi:SRSO17 transposase|nr:IS701 family transposase [Dehalococcoidia bacterium]